MQGHDAQRNRPGSIGQPPRAGPDAVLSVRRPVELLAPAGDFEALKAAVANGADAVYFGLDDFNARHRAANFTLATLEQALGYLHAHGARGYVTFNTLVFSDELPRAAAYLRAIIEAGADALIVQDLGLVRLIKEMSPNFPVHASTQMTLTCARGIEFARSLGVERVILARELSTRDVRRLAAATSMPLEVFVHGALCVAYSGQCLTSEALGGRSANRGQCAQACRQPYDLVVDGKTLDLGDKKYLLSPRDLAAWDLVEELARLGVASLKIEGRLKSAQYVAAATHAYRQALDAAAAGRPFALSRQEQLDLAQSFSRGFTHGFLAGTDHQSLVERAFPKARGIKVGTVAGVTPRGLLVELDAQHAQPGGPGGRLDWLIPLKPGDGVVIDEGRPEQDEQGGRVYAVRERSTRQSAAGPPADRGFRRGAPRNAARGRQHAFGGAGAGLLIELEFGRGAVNLAAVPRGALVWKTSDPVLKRRLARRAAALGHAGRRPLDFSISLDGARRLVVVVRDNEGHSATVRSPMPLQTAREHQTTRALVEQQFGRLGGTPFRLGGVTMWDGPAPVDRLPVMAPKSVLNALRRHAVELLLEQASIARRSCSADESALGRLRAQIARPGAPRAASAAGRPVNDHAALARPAAPLLCVLCRTLEQMQGVLAWRPDDDLPGVAWVYLDLEDVRRSADAVRACRAAGLPAAVATPRIIKPREEGLLLQVARCRPEGVLARNLGAVGFFAEKFPEIVLIGDYSLNVVNELAADLFRARGVARLVPGYDLNFSQLRHLLERFDPARFEIVLHQHLPMFHMEHCVFSHLLSQGRDFHDCGRPCERHRAELRDHLGQAHPLVADVGCRNTVFNAHAQSAAPYVARLMALGVRAFRVELLREDARETARLLERYAGVLAGRDTGLAAWQGLRVLQQVGLTRGTLEFE